ncbi:hypothetical protein [Spiroplasma endosymbiont of Crioceris asparagi]|uniref:hypothetical protein n=1 Tax=Spiroplasma endosymbiont of Crioceris asparagi TaxID=3066286 RepID=UPI0030CF6E06
MSYYEKNKYSISTHSFYRIKERLNMRSKTDLELNIFVNELINNSTDVIDTKKTLYVNTQINDVYLVIDKISNLVITATKISHEKQIRIIEEDK